MGTGRAEKPRASVAPRNLLRRAVVAMNSAAHYVTLAEVIEHRRNARLGDWVSFASGIELDRRHPVVALVRGWEGQGLVEVATKSVREMALHQFKRTRADFPPGWFDPPPPGPLEPEAFRDPKAIHGGAGSMAQHAVEGDEHPDWLRFAAVTLADELLRQDQPSPETAFRAALTLRAFAYLLDPEGNSARFAEIRWRRPGRQATGQRWSRVLAEHAAAHAVEAAVAAGEKKGAALLGVASKTGISEGRIKGRLAQYRRALSWPEGRAIAEAAQLVRAMTSGGLTQAAAVELIAGATGKAPAAIRKALTESKKSE